MEIVITEGQARALETKASHFAMIGGLGSAKTRAACLCMEKWISEWPGVHFSFWGQTHEKLRDSIKREFDLLLAELGYEEDKDFFYNKSLKFYRFGNNAEVHLRSLDVDDSKIKGPQWGGVIGDEMDTTKEEKWKLLKHRARAPHGPRQVKIFLNGVPPAHWAYREFLGPKRLEGYEAIRQTSYDNPFLPEDIIRQMEQTYLKNSAAYKRWMLGQCVALTGSVYNCFNHEIHLVEPEDAPDHYVETFGGLDLGVRDPSVLEIVGIDDAGRCFVYDEWVSQEFQSPTQQAKEILLKTQEHGFTPFSDHDLGMRLTFEEEGVQTIAADKDVDAGIKTVNKMFLNGHLYIIKGKAPYLEQCLQLQQWKPPSATSDNEEPMHEHSHANDALRYGIYTRFGSNVLSVGEQQSLVNRINRYR